MLFTMTIRVIMAFHILRISSAVHAMIDTKMNSTLSSINLGCKFNTSYEATSTRKFLICVGQSADDLKNGEAIISLIKVRGYLPTCRILQLLLWMAATVHDTRVTSRDFFVDVGANIGSCTSHIASFGFPVISIDPVPEHINIIQGTLDINPSFHIQLHHMGISSQSRNIRAYLLQGRRNWGSTMISESGTGTQMVLKSLDEVVRGRRVSLIKIDCEGCEWGAIKG